MESKSPFVVHRAKIIGDYGTAEWLRSVVLAMWNGSAHKVGLSKLVSLDDEHFRAFMEMLESYRRHGENDPAFLAIADECRELECDEETNRE